MKSGVGADALDEATFASYLYTAGQPDPDLMIRTSGEMRVSNFLLWQIAYAEIWVTDALWPDFRARHLFEAIVDYQKRDRRYGAIAAQPVGAQGLAAAPRVDHPIVSALVLIAIVGGTVWALPPVATAMLAAVVSGLAAIELGLLVKRWARALPQQAVVFGAAATTLAVSAAMSFKPFEPEAAIVMLLGFLMLSGAIALTFAPGLPVFLSISVMMMAVVYVGLPLGTLAWVRVVHGPAVLTWLVGVIAISDSAQYYSGTLLGSRKLAPVISPKKTIEGAIGGLVAAVIAGWGLGQWALPGRAPAVLAGVAIVLAIAGMVGGLVRVAAQTQRRRQGQFVADSGHGGVLDRVDAYLFAAPVFYIYLRYLA
jgi:predicted CDP-diglyceride synthetase/phosphatidate cytidylyltransferase